MGNIDLDDRRAGCLAPRDRLAAIMITYSSTYGVFDSQVRQICALVRAHGGRVDIDGANMNAMAGGAARGEFGGDVSHLNPHKTNCIAHGGGPRGRTGPRNRRSGGVPAHPGCRPGRRVDGPAEGRLTAVGAVSPAPLGNASVLPISWMYMRMMGSDDLTAAIETETETETAILSADSIAARLAPHDAIHFSGRVEGIAGGGLAHEGILDLRPLKESTSGERGIGAEDVLERLIDYGFHAWTPSCPLVGTLMVEPTEGESLAELELDRFCDAMIAICAEIAKVESGHLPRDDNPPKAAPHTAAALPASEWQHPYSREEAAYPLESLRHAKYWPPVGRVDNIHGDRNLICACPPVSSYAALGLPAVH